MAPVTVSLPSQSVQAQVGLIPEFIYPNQRIYFTHFSCHPLELLSAFIIQKIINGRVLKPSLPPPPRPALASLTTHCRLVTEEQDLLLLDYNSMPTDVESKIILHSAGAGTLHAVAIWVDYQLDEKSRWSTFRGGSRARGGGTSVASVDGDDHCGGEGYHKQMLSFLPSPIKVGPGREHGIDGVVTVSGRFDAEGGRMMIDVKEFQ